MTPGFGAGVAAAVCVYLLSLIVVSVFARRRGPQRTFGDFYLAGRGLGVVVTVATLFATRLAGMSLIATPAEMMESGLAAGVRVGCYSMVVSVVCLYYAPLLHRLAHRHAFVTPGDWITYRYRSPTLTLLFNVVLVVAAFNLLLTFFMAMGHATAGLSGGAVPYWVGVVLLTVVVILYESFGGMRAVAWTDCVQGGMLLIGLAGLLIAVAPTPANLQEITLALAATAPERVATPPAEVTRHWISMITVMGLAAATYPQVVQRIYAARDTATIKRAFRWMVSLPFISTSVTLLVAMVAITQSAGVGDPDQMVPALLSGWSTQSALHYVIALLVVTAIIAGLMSSADSLLLSVSSILAKEIVGPTLMKGASEERLTHVGKLLSWGIAIVLVGVALSPSLTLWGMLELKAEIHVQVAPMFILGVTWRRLTAHAALGGLLAGCATYAALLLAGLPMVWDMHAGLFALAANLATCIVLTLRRYESTAPLPRPAGAAAGA